MEPPEAYPRAFVEWLIATTYKQGFEDGVSFADTEIEWALWRCIDPGPEMRPYHFAADPGEPGRHIVRQLIDNIRPAAVLRRKR